jgi:hypothetical protein
VIGLIGLLRLIGLMLPEFYVRAVIVVRNIDGAVVGVLVRGLVDPREAYFTDETRKALYAFIDEIGCVRSEKQMLYYADLRLDLMDLVKLVDFACDGEWQYVSSVLPIWLKDRDWLKYENKCRDGD